MRGPDLGRFVSRSILIGGAVIAHSDVHPIAPDLTSQFPQGHIFQHSEIFLAEDHDSKPRENHGVTQRRHGHIFERPAKMRSSYSHHPSLHGFIPNHFDSGFMGTEGTTPDSIGGNHSSSDNGSDFFPPTTNEVRKGGKVISKFISQSARAREGETVDAGLMRQLNTLEYQFRRITSLPSADQQVVVTSFFKTIGELEPPPPPPDNWLADATPGQREKIDWALEVIVAGGFSAGTFLALVHETYKKKGFKKVVPMVLAMASLVSACGMNAVETATALLPGSQLMTTEQPPTLANPNVSVATETPTPNSIPPGDPVTFLGGGSGGQEISCDATAGTLVDRFRTPAGSRIPKGLMTLHSADTTLWSADEMGSLTDSIASVVEEIKRSIAAIDAEADVTNVVSGEGYVLVVTKKGKYVWAIDINGAPQSRPDVITGTKGFKIIPDPPPGVEGDKRYAVSGGCGVLGVYKDGNMIAVYKPIADKWELVNPPPSESATPVELASTIPIPSETPEPSATPTLAPASDALREFSQLNISFPDRLQAESHEDGFKTRVVLSEDLMKNTGITDLNIPEDQMDQIGKYILGVAMWGNRTANPKLSAFAQLPNLDVSGDKVVALSESLLMSGNSVELSFSDGQRTIKGPVSSLQVMFVTTNESDQVLEHLKLGDTSYVERTVVIGGEKTRNIFIIKNKILFYISSSNFSGSEMPLSGGARQMVKFEAYQGSFYRNPTEKLVDFGIMLHTAPKMLIVFSPAGDDYKQVFGNDALTGRVANYFCSGSWDPEIAKKNNTYWRGEGGKLTGCDPAAIKLFSPKAP